MTDNALAIERLKNIKTKVESIGDSVALDVAISALSDAEISSNKITEMDVKEYCDKHNLTVIDNNYKEEFVRAWCRHNGFLPPRKRKQKSKLNIMWFENIGDDE